MSKEKRDYLRRSANPIRYGNWVEGRIFEICVSKTEYEEMENFAKILGLSSAEEYVRNLLEAGRRLVEDGPPDVVTLWIGENMISLDITDLFPKRGLVKVVSTELQ